MNDTITEFDIEDYSGRLLSGMEKTEYLVNVIGEKIQKQASQNPECTLLQHEMCIHLDIIDDYIHEAINTINELQKKSQYK